MKIRNALRILVDNFSNTYKLLLYRVITTLLFMGLSYVILSLGLHAITSSEELQTIFELVKNFLKAVTSGDSGYLESFQEIFFAALKNFASLVGDHIGSIVGSVIGVILLYIASRFINGLAVFAMANTFNDKMAFYSKTHFSAAYFKNIGQAALYQVIYVPITFVYDLLSVALCWFLFFFAPSLFPGHGFLTVLAGISLTLAAFVCLEALKMTIVSSWLPAVVTGKGVIEGLKISLSAMRKGAGERFSNYLILLFLLVVGNVACACFTVGSFLIISIPASFLLLLCLQLVFYYEDNGMRYFVTLNQISGEEEKPEGLGE